MVASQLALSARGAQLQAKTPPNRSIPPPTQQFSSIERIRIQADAERKRQRMYDQARLVIKIEQEGPPKFTSTLNPKGRLKAYLGRSPLPIIKTPHIHTVETLGSEAIQIITKITAYAEILRRHLEE